MTSRERSELKQVTADPVLAVACHQAAHAVAGILLGIRFACAEIGPGGAAGVGRVVVEGKPDLASEEGKACAMVGAAFDALLRPTAPLVSILARSCKCGFCKATWPPAPPHDHGCFAWSGWIPPWLEAIGCRR